MSNSECHETRQAEVANQELRVGIGRSGAAEGLVVIVDDLGKRDLPIGDESGSGALGDGEH